MRNKRRWAAAFVLVCTACLLTALGFLVDYMITTIRTNRVNAELRAMYAAQTDAPTPEPTRAPTPAPTAPQATAAPTDTPAPTRVPAMLSRFSSLYARNHDAAGWIQVDALPGIDFPVVKRDNTFYLTRDYNGQKNAGGAAFLDERNSILPCDTHLFVYAHNMKNGTMFGSLTRLRDVSRIAKAPLVTFSTLYQDRQYVPLALYECVVNPAKEAYFPLLQFNYANEAAFDRYIEQARAMSCLYFPVDVHYGDSLLSLVTCVGDDDMRLVYLLRAVRPDEDAALLAGGISTLLKNQ